MPGDKGNNKQFESHQEVIQSLEKFAIALQNNAKAENSQKVVASILSWTNLDLPAMEVIMALIERSNATIALNQEQDTVDAIVTQQLIQQWEDEKLDQGLFLRKIRDSLLNDKEVTSLLELYSKIHENKVMGDRSIENTSHITTLLNLKLIAEVKGTLNVSNGLYRKVFNLTWVEEKIKERKPYISKFREWMQSQDPSQLLRGAELEEAIECADEQELSDDEHKFLIRSQVADCTP